jgi:hypothetical protein
LDGEGFISPLQGSKDFREFHTQGCALLRPGLLYTALSALKRETLKLRIDCETALI